MKSTTVVFRVDSSYKIGIGHIKRCLALATDLSLTASQLIFISRNLLGNISDEIFQAGYGKKILSLGLKKVNYSKFIAFVKDTNKVSMNLFGLAGFVRIESDIKTQF